MHQCFNGPQGLTLLTLDPHLGCPTRRTGILPSSTPSAKGGCWKSDTWAPRAPSCRVCRKQSSDALLHPRAAQPSKPLASADEQQGNQNYWRPFSNGGVAGTCNDADPNCYYGSIGLISGITNSSYNSLQTSLRKRLGYGVAFLLSYTYSKSLDDVSSFNITGSAPTLVAGENDLAQNPADLAAEYGRSLFDARQRLVFSYQWQLPFWKESKNWYQSALGNWQLNGIYSASTGTPFTVYDSSDPSLQGNRRKSPALSAIARIWWAIPTRVPGQRPNGSTPQRSSASRNPARLATPAEISCKPPASPKWISGFPRIFAWRNPDLAVPGRAFQHSEPGELWRAE